MPFYTNLCSENKIEYCQSGFCFLYWSSWNFLVANFMQLTIKEHQAYQIIRCYILRNGHAPTERELAKLMKISSRGVAHRYVEGLVKKGYLSIERHKKRSIRLINGSDIYNGHLPLVGEVAAGEPVEIVDSDKMLDLSGLLLGNDRFVIRVADDAMHSEKICAGDYVIFENRSKVDNGEIVMVLIHGKKAILRRIQFNDDKTITLYSHDLKLAALVYPAKDVKVQGAYLGLIRLKH